MMVIPMPTPRRKTALKRKSVRKPVKRSDLLIIECDSAGLAEQAMNLGTWFGRILNTAFRERRIALIQTSTEAQLKQDLDAVFDKFGRFRNVLVVGHSNARFLGLTKERAVPWLEVGQIIKRFQPVHLFLAACNAGRSEAVRDIFPSVKSLREIYGSPVPLLKIHTAPMAVLILMHLLKGKVSAEESAGLRIASFISWGVQTYSWRREEVGPGNELSMQFWDAVAERLGLTSWDLADEVVKMVKKFL
jgi:hypothetical protein